MPNSQDAEIEDALVAALRMGTAEVPEHPPRSFEDSTRRGRLAGSFKSRPQTRWFVGIAAAVIAVVAITAALTSTGSSGPRATSGTQLVALTEHDGEITVRITDPQNAASELATALKAHHLDVTVKLVPVAPNNVGVLFEETFARGSSGTIQQLNAENCATKSEQQCEIGFVISAGFKGPVSVVLGRPGKPGEQWNVQTGLFGNGQPLHCTSALNASPAHAASVATAHGLRVVAWNVDGGRNGIRITPTKGYVVGGIQKSTDEIWFQVDPKPITASSPFARAAADWTAACPVHLP